MFVAAAAAAAAVVVAVVAAAVFDCCVSVVGFFRCLADAVENLGIVGAELVL